MADNRLSLVAGSRDGDSIMGIVCVVGHGGSTGDLVVGKGQSGGKSGGGDGRVCIGDFHIGDATAGAHVLGEVGGTQGDFRIHSQVELLGFGTARRVALVAGGGDGDFKFAGSSGRTADRDGAVFIRIIQTCRNGSVGDGGIFVVEGHGCNFAVLAHSLGEIAGSGEFHGVVDGKDDLSAVGSRTGYVVGVHRCGTDYGVGDCAVCFSGRGSGYGCAGGGVQVGGRTPCVGYVAVGCLRAGGELCAAAEAEVGVAADGIHRDGRCVHSDLNALDVGFGTGHTVGVDRCRCRYNISSIAGGRHGNAAARFLVAPCVGHSARIGGGFN